MDSNIMNQEDNLNLFEYKNIIDKLCLIELHSCDDTVYKLNFIHSDETDPQNDIFLENKMDLEDKLSDYFDKYKPFKNIDHLKLTCHITKRSSVCHEDRYYPKQCLRCDKILDYSERFNKCTE